MPMRPTDTIAEAKRLFYDALALQQAGRWEQAALLYQEALALAPERPSTMNNLASVFIELKRYSEARVLCEKILESEPRDVAVLLNLGNCQIKQGLAAEALESFEKALRLEPDHAGALSGRGNALLALNRREEAIESYVRTLTIDPEFPEAHYNRGNALQEQGLLEEALASYDRALATMPRYAEALYSRGNALLGLGRLEEALASYDRALAITPGHVDALNNSGAVLIRLNRRGEAIGIYQRLLEVAPEYPCVSGHRLNSCLHCCEWAEYESYVAQVVNGIRDGKRVDTPFNFLAISESAADQLNCAQISADAKYANSSDALWQGECYHHDKIRLAYVSADFYDHAMSNLLVGLYEAHDRTRFDISAISLGPDRADAMRERLRRTFDRFIDVRGKDDQSVALLLREMEIDIAIDLQGYTVECRPKIFSHRAAPVQINYLGYPGTMGANYMDYLIGDRIVIPLEHQPCYSENIVYLPDCYQANDDKRGIAARSPSRAELGLPQHGFVFCCFNNNYKITPLVFDIWMRLLDKTRGSVLWLLEDSKVAARNLRREAERRGVAPDRLIFAPRMTAEDHLARQRAADLFLDTRPYNAHVTASDALWAGLPLVTCIGHTFAGRVAASLLNAVGLPELVTTSWEEYERLALELASNAERLAAVKAKLAGRRTATPLFDTRRYCRQLEAAYVTMWERSQRGEPPVSFAVPAIS